MLIGGIGCLNSFAVHINDNHLLRCHKAFCQTAGRCEYMFTIQSLTDISACAIDISVAMHQLSNQTHLLTEFTLMHWDECPQKLLTQKFSSSMKPVDNRFRASK